MDDLLKEAIADAKAVRETALANAKMALEEAFTPRLKSMLAQKIQQEIEDEDSHDEDEDAGLLSSSLFVWVESTFSFFFFFFLFGQKNTRERNKS